MLFLATLLTASSASPDVRPPQLVGQVEPVYPEAAGQQHGEVRLLVDVDVDGSVTGVRVESGPPVFHEAALAAGWMLRFEPAVRNERAVAVKTRVYFHFQPPLPEDPDESIEIVIHADDSDSEDTRARTTLSVEELERSTGDDLAETVEQVAGVQAAAGTADASKPIIRGHEERRLLVLFDGIRQESQKWGADHATEIDPFAAGEVSVIRGAAGSRFGPDAIGGVILVEPPAMRTDVGLGGKAVLAYRSNGRRPYGALRLDAVPKSWPALSLRVEGNASAGMDLRSPDYVLGNTASRPWNVGASAQLRGDKSTVRLSYRHYDLTAGIFYGVQNSTAASFLSQLEQGRPLGAEDWRQSYGISRPRQFVQHDIVSLRAGTTGKLGSLKTVVAYQSNHRQEFDVVRSSVTGSQFNFLLRTMSLDSLYRHPVGELAFGVLEGGLGVQGSFQENIYRGPPLIPNHRSYSGGVFAFERLALKGLDLELGLRADAMDRTAFLEELSYERHTRRDTLNDEICQNNGDYATCNSRYPAASASLGAIVHLLPERFNLKLELSQASRFPNMDELYLIGSAPSFPVFAIGSPDLQVERSRGGSATAVLNLPVVQAEVSGFASRVDNYIAFAPERLEDGSVAFDVTARGTWPRYGYRGTTAALYGVDGSFALGGDGPLALHAQGSMVRAVDLDANEDILGLPGDRARVELIARNPRALGLHDLEFGFGVHAVAQRRLSGNVVDFAPPPDGYVTFDLRFETEVHVQNRSFRLGAQARNLLDARYREATGLLRYYGDQPGRDVRVRVSTDF